MSKGKASAKAAKAEAVLLTSKNTAVDPVLASLFSASSGPVSAPVRSVSKHVTKNDTQDLDEQDGGVKIVENQSDVSSAEETDSENEAEPRPRKRRRLSEEDDLEATYLNKLAREEQKEDLERLKEKSSLKLTPQEDKEEDSDSDDTASSASNDLDDLSDLEPESKIPQHESLTKDSTDYEKSRRTVFLGNVSTEAIKSKTSRKDLENHLKSVLDADTEKIESLRFRSTAFNVTAGPKKAAYAKKDLMDETTKSTNAYVVLNTEAAARKITKRLNGTVILNRHLHTDWLAHPTAADHKRCLFIGNLTFVDLESNIDTTNNNSTSDSKPPRRPKAREPADAEEGLWRACTKFGIVESVRVVRDKTTRVGKGFAYVQFADEVAAEKALSLDGKKFPPMLPRLLRVSRAKRVLKKDLKRKRDDNDQQSFPKSKKRDSRNINKKSATGPGFQKRGGDGGVVFEGYRASAANAMKFKSKGKKKAGVKPANRSSRRGAAFKAGGGKKKRDVK